MTSKCVSWHILKAKIESSCCRQPLEERQVNPGTLKICKTAGKSLSTGDQVQMNKSELRPVSFPRTKIMLAPCTKMGREIYSGQQVKAFSGSSRGYNSGSKITMLTRVRLVVSRSGGGVEQTSVGRCWGLCPRLFLILPQMLRLLQQASSRIRCSALSSSAGRTL